MDADTLMSEGEPVRENPARAGQDLAAGLRSVVLERGYERREKAFALSSGGTSHDYVDMRRAVGRGADLELAARAVIAVLDQAGVAFDAIGGMTMGADPVAHAVAVLAHSGWFSVRKAPKEHGTGRRIEGTEIGPGTRVVVFEDTVSTGRSMLEALEVVAETSAEVVALCTLLDRGDKLARELGHRRVAAPLISVLTYEDLGIEPL